MCYVCIVKRISSIFLSALFVLPCFSQTVNITVFRHYSTNKILWGGDGNSAWDALQLERRGAFLYSYALQTSGLLGGLDIDISSTDSLQNVYDRLATNPIEDFKYVDWGGDWSGNITPYFPSGHVFRDDDTGLPSGVVMNQGGEMSTVPLEPSGAGFVSSPVVNNGVTGQWYVTDTDGIAFSQFIPSWSGGAQNTPGNLTIIDPFDPSASFVPPAGGGGGGGDVSSSSSYTYNQPSTTTVNQDGDTYNVVDTPQYNISISSGNGGDPINIPVYDYRAILNSIGGTLKSHAIQNNKDLNAINENLIKVLQVQDDGTMDVAPTDDTEYTVDSSEADNSLSEVSGWGFDFGMESNPIGSAFTSILGNPPTSFGSVDRVWDIRFDLGNGIEVQSTFSLSDWFPRAFRSCILFIATIVFAIATAKAVSGAFS